MGSLMSIHSRPGLMGLSIKVKYVPTIVSPFCNHQFICKAESMMIQMPKCVALDSGDSQKRSPAMYWLSLCQQPQDLSLKDYQVNRWQIGNYQTGIVVNSAICSAQHYSTFLLECLKSFSIYAMSRTKVLDRGTA